ncbi:MAG: signal peptidase I [Clostridiales bacterium GWB2_37_7]|nr:MAG: signal peptidase I [Clostridiales bacterium GWB2_37_7]
MEGNNNDNTLEVKEGQQAEQKSNRDEILSWVKMIVSAFVIAIVLRTFVFQMALVNQISMNPTLYEGQMLMISKINYLVGNPQRGDIVVLKDDVENKLLIKRVIGLPGEEIQVQNGKVYIDSKELEPDYTSFPTYASTQEAWNLSQGEYFVLGDNRERSRDSRSEDVGLISRNNIIGKAVFRIWPLNKLGLLK